MGSHERLLIALNVDHRFKICWHMWLFIPSFFTLHHFVYFQAVADIIITKHCHSEIDPVSLPLVYVFYHIISLFYFISISFSFSLFLFLTTNIHYLYLGYFILHFYYCIRCFPMHSGKLILEFKMKGVGCKIHFKI